MPSATGGEAIVSALLAQGLHTVFGLPGVQLDGLFNALYDSRERLRVIHSRHEQGAGYMALGQALATGGIGAYAVVPGPGLLNSSAALATAYGLNARVLCLTGQVPSAFIDRGIGQLHEIPRQLDILRTLTKWAARIEHPAQAPALVSEAFRQLNSGRPRPVGLETAMDVLAARAAVGEPQPSTASPPAPLDPDAMQAAAKLLGNAANPLIFVGGGALEASQEVAALAELIQAPVIASGSARGVLSSRHYLSHAWPAGHRLWKQADVVLAVGTRLQYPLASWGLDDGLKIIRLDVDPVEHNRLHPPAVSLVADAKTALAELVNQTAGVNRARGSREPEMRALQQEMEAAYAALEPQHGFIQAIREELPDEAIVVDDLTQVGYVSRFALPVYQPRSYLTPGYQGTLGWSLPCAMGAKVAFPDRPVLGICGDGGFMFNVQELASAVQHRIPVVMLVFNDGAYGNVKRMQKELYGNRQIATHLQNPDFVKLAESFGALGLRVADAKGLRTALRRALAADIPAVVEVQVREMPGPWNFYLMPKVRG